MIELTPIDPQLYDLNARVVFFPVRHHSPTCARLVREVAERIHPDAILIEGPADFNPHMAELNLPHQLPVAIYSYVGLADGTRRGAFYPFCVYSPEWSAIRVGTELGIPTQFIDMPWAEIALDDDSQTVNRYADGPLKMSGYIQSLCRDIGVESFDDLWDTLFEIDVPTLAEYLERMHRLCYYMRVSDGLVSAVDEKREVYMAAMIRNAAAHYPGRLLVVTGGFHSAALIAQLTSSESYTTPEMRSIQTLIRSDITTGIALTPYSYERLDNLKGYASGMPNPGFYHEAWLDEPTAVLSYRRLLARVVQMLRERHQIVSAADLIAVESTARALADLRGHRRVWRRDLLDGVIGALVKEEFAYGSNQPFLEAVYEVFRGKERGKLAVGTSLPPLVQQIGVLLEAHGLQPEADPRELKLDLTKELSRSQILHQLRVLGLPGYIQLDPLNLDDAGDHIEELWRIHWTPEFEAACIESAIYGPVLEDASQARLQEKADSLVTAETPSAAKAVELLLDAVLIGLPQGANSFYVSLTQLVAQDGNFFTVAQGLRHLLYLYRFDAILGVAGHANIGELLRSTFARALWLLENLGSVMDNDQALLDGIRALRETFERCGPILNTDLQDFAAVFERAASDSSQTALLRGAAHGVLWTLHRITELSRTLKLFAGPDQLGDFLTGLFSLAREVVQREGQLIEQINMLLMDYDDDGFLEALPSLRLAFSFFLPREKHYLTQRLFEDSPEVLPIPLEVSAEQALRVLAFENNLSKAMIYYGVLND